MKRFVILALALLAFPAATQARQAHKRAIDDVIEALTKAKRGGKVEVPKAEPFEHSLLRGPDGKLRSWDDLMRRGPVDETLPAFRNLDESLRAVARSDPREAARVLERHGDEGASVLRRIGPEGLALDRHLGGELVDTVRDVEKSASRMRAAGQAVEEADHARGLLAVAKKTGKEGLAFVRENWTWLAAAGVVATFYANPGIIEKWLERTGRGVRSVPGSIIKGILYNEDGSASLLGFSLVALAGLALLSWVGSLLRPIWDRLRRKPAPAVPGSGTISAILLGIGLAGAAALYLQDRTLDRARVAALENAGVERGFALQARQQLEMAEADETHAGRLLEEADEIRRSVPSIRLEIAESALAAGREADALDAEAQTFREARRRREVQVGSLRERAACEEAAEASLRRNRGRPDLSDTDSLVQAFQDLGRRAEALPLKRIEP